MCFLWKAHMFKVTACTPVSASAAIMFLPNGLADLEDKLVVTKGDRWWWGEGTGVGGVGGGLGEWGWMGSWGLARAP